MVGACASRGQRERTAGRPQRSIDRNAGQPIHRADEVSDKARGGTVIDVLRCPNLRDASVGHHGDAIAQRHRFGLIVRHIDGGDGERAQQPIDVDAQTLAQLGVERGQRFIEQQHARLHGERPRERDALSLPSRQLIDAALPVSAHMHHVEKARNLPRAFASVQCAADLESVADIFRDVHVGKERVALEHHADIAPFDR